MRACVRACASVCVRACVRACVRGCLRAYVRAFACMCVCIGFDAGGIAHGDTAQVEFFGFSGARWKTKKLPVAVPPPRGITLVAVVSFGGTATFVVCCSVACIDACVHVRAEINSRISSKDD